MNTVQAFLAAHGERLGVERLGLEGMPSCLFVTPRFRASASVVVLVSPPKGGDPVLVAKIPRLADGDAGMDREAASLRAAQERRPGGYTSIPTVVAYERFGDRPVLIETALAGRALSPAVVRRRPQAMIDLVERWLVERVRDDAPVGPDDVHRLVTEPLHRFALALPGEADLVERSLALVEPLAGAALPSVVEHGDLSHPNLVLGPIGDLGVVDWEMAEARGLPLHDLLFFLTFVAFARAGARTLGEQMAAFDDDFAAGGDARRAVEDHAARLGIDGALIGPLFVACWARYTAALLGRVRREGPVGEGTAAWLASNRWYAPWQRAVAQGGW